MPKLLDLAARSLMTFSKQGPLIPYRAFRPSQALPFQFGQRAELPYQKNTQVLIQELIFDRDLTPMPSLDNSSKSQPKEAATGYHSRSIKELCTRVPYELLCKDVIAIHLVQTAQYTSADKPEKFYYSGHIMWSLLNIFSDDIVVVPGTVISKRPKEKHLNSPDARVPAAFDTEEEFYNRLVVQSPNYTNYGSRNFITV